MSNREQVLQQQVHTLTSQLRNATAHIERLEAPERKRQQRVTEENEVATAGGRMVPVFTHNDIRGKQLFDGDKIAFVTYAREIGLGIVDHLTAKRIHCLGNGSNYVQQKLSCHILKLGDACPF